MEKPGHAINLAISVGKWKPIKLERIRPSLSHLFFTNDLVLFGEVNVDNV